MISADEDHVSPAGRTAGVHRILPAAGRVRIEAFVEEGERRPEEVAAGQGAVG